MKWSVGLGAALACLLGVGSAEAVQTKRETFSVRGGVRVIGSTMGFDCGAGATAPPGTSVDCTGELPPFADDSAPDVYWRDNEANALILPNDARTSATLDIPEGSTIRHARIYWGARVLTPLADEDVIVDRAAAGGGQVTTSDRQNVVTLEGVEGLEHYYQSTADITDVAKALGAGEYRVTNIDAALFPNVTRDVLYAGWAIVVVFENPASPLTHVTVYDGLDELAPDATPAVTSQETTLDFFAAKTLTHRTWLTVLGYEGDEAQRGDQLSVNGTPIQNALNPLGNFFNSSRTTETKGASPEVVAVTGAKDAPPLSGAPASMASYDLDRVEISPFINVSTTGSAKEPGQASATVNVTSNEDNLLVGAYVVEALGCTAETAAEDCGPQGRCDEATGNCLPPCTPGDDSTCPDGRVCLVDPSGNPYCGCEKDSDCGGPNSGMVCDVDNETGQGNNKCVEGCRGIGGNGCPIGQDCSSKDESIGICGRCETNEDCPERAPICREDGVCVCTSDEDCPEGQYCALDREPPRCVPYGTLILEGGGFDGCAMGSSGGSKGLALAAGALGLATALRMRRRRRRG